MDVQIQTMNSLLQSFQGSDAAKDKVARAQTGVMVLAIRKMSKLDELSAALTAANRADHFPPTERAKLQQAISNEIERASNLLACRARQAWDFRHLMPASLQMSLGEDDGHDKLMVWLLKSGLWTPTEDTYKLMSVLFLLATQQSELSLAARNLHLKSVKSWWAKAKKGKGPEMPYIVELPTNAADIAIQHPEIHAKMYDGEGPSMCVFRAQDIEALMVGAWMRIHPKSGQIPLSKVQPQVQNNGEISLLPMLQQLISHVIPQQQRESDLNINMQAPRQQSRGNMNWQRNCNLQEMLPSIMPPMLEDSQRQLPPLMPPDTDDSQNSNTVATTRASPKHQQLARLRSVLEIQDEEGSMSSATQWQPSSSQNKGKEKHAEDMRNAQKTEADDACAVVLKAIQSRNLIKKDKALPPLLFESWGPL